MPLPLLTDVLVNPSSGSQFKASYCNTVCLFAAQIDFYCYVQEMVDNDKRWKSMKDVGSIEKVREDNLSAYSVSANHLTVLDERLRGLNFKKKIFHFC